MPRLRMLTNVLALPGEIRFRGYERDFDEAEAATLLATRQWELVKPPEPEPAGDEPTAKPDAEWTDDTAAAVAAARGKARKPKEEIRNKPQG